MTEVTDLEQTQYDLCEGSTKSQAPTFSGTSSSPVQLVVAENFRLGEEKPFKAHITFYQVVPKHLFLWRKDYSAPHKR